MSTEDFKKLMDDVRQVSRDLHDKKKGSIRRADTFVKKLKLQRLNFSASALTSAINDAKKVMPRKDW